MCMGMFKGKNPRVLEERQWLKANCSVCGREYEYLPEYKPATCASWDCVHKWLHHRKEVMSSEQRTGTSTTG